MAKLDDVKWHTGGDFPADVPASAGATHMGMFLAWAAQAGLLATEHEVGLGDTVTALRARTITPGTAIRTACDGVLSGELFSQRGGRFAEAYYDADEGSYLDDYADEFWDTGETIYHVPDSWVSYDRIAARVSERYEVWLAAKGRARGLERARGLGHGHESGADD
ncbi:hypothetical protein FB468_3007 [Leucobacter komagatae]|uniref:DUF7832 domain-containing protein n=1 Tax=Leucobacter komagatae TaxID=55969 RepID=A0A542XXC4_9MICO|nr:hypothetical protein [Leucobacter komagatae]TQL40486.1 hypothetical protein FB468_3007 [Leucobacter komagatae]